MKERTGAHEGDTPLTCLHLAHPFFLVPTTSKRLLRRLSKGASTNSTYKLMFLHALHCYL